MSMGSPATQKQIDYILRLGGKSYVSQVNKAYNLGMSNRERQGVMTKSEASRHIDRLLELTRGDSDD